MRQAIEEGFILDVLKHYTTYATYFRLLKACEDDPNVERKKAAQNASLPDPDRSSGIWMERERLGI